MEISKPNLVFFAIILVTGALTIFTDLKSKKIYNQHLAVSAILGFLALFYTVFWTHDNFRFHLMNGAIAFVSGYCFHRLGLWKGGDAKLFTLYAFLMPALQRGHFLFSSAINLFACSFIIGAIILIPFFIKDIALNYNTVIPKLLSREKYIPLIVATGRTVFIFWALFPIYYFIGNLHWPIMSLIVTYLIFYLARPSQTDKKRSNIKRIPSLASQNLSPEEKALRTQSEQAAWKRSRNIMLGLTITFGILTRLWLSPLSLSWPVLPYSILKIILLSTLSAGIYATIDLLNEYRDRIPFAPLLFTGCLLCYTPFLFWILCLIIR